MSLNIVFDDKQFFSEMQNIIEYANGFMSGVQTGRPVMMKNLAYQLKNILYEFVDSMARIDPASLGHVYEWYQTGSPEGRLYSLDCITTGAGITFSYTFSQSKSIKAGSKVPFYDKATIMESGMPITITPRDNGVLVFTENGQDVFTRRPVIVPDPGGPAAANGFSDAVKMFFDQYISQSMLDVTGIRQQFEDTSDFGKNLSAGKTGGYSVGVSVGERWVSNIGIIA